MVSSLCRLHNIGSNPWAGSIALLREATLDSEWNVTIVELSVGFQAKHGTSGRKVARHKNISPFNENIGVNLIIVIKTVHPKAYG